jgi:single-strand DNA-binding protein
MDVAVSDYFKGNETTTWVRVRSNRHINLSKWLTKGKMILVEGTLSAPTIWTSKDGEEHVQLSVMADNIHFVNTGKKKEEDKTQTPQETTKQGAPKDDDPLPAPADGKEDLPF